eukprot:scaffold1643_cov390-Prasinococcus_capsulatus_cf.AAC.8
MTSRSALRPQARVAERRPGAVTAISNQSFWRKLRHERLIRQSERQKSAGGMRTGGETPSPALPSGPGRRGWLLRSGSPAQLVVTSICGASARASVTGQKRRHAPFLQRLGQPQGKPEAACPQELDSRPRWSLHPAARGARVPGRADRPPAGRAHKLHVCEGARATPAASSAAPPRPAMPRGDGQRRGASGRGRAATAFPVADERGPN